MYTIYTKNGLALIQNYRPESVLTPVSKTFVRIIQKQFSSYSDEFLSPALYGYRKCFNTQYAFLIEKWKKTLNNTGYTGVTLMDLSTALDTIDNEQVITTLYACGFSKDNLKLIHSCIHV